MNCFVWIGDVLWLFWTRWREQDGIKKKTSQKQSIQRRKSVKFFDGIRYLQDRSIHPTIFTALFNILIIHLLFQFLFLFYFENIKWRSFVHQFDILSLWNSWTIFDLCWKKKKIICQAIHRLISMFILFISSFVLVYFLNFWIRRRGRELGICRV